MRTISQLAAVLVLSVSAMSVNAVVISQIYGGGNVGAMYTHDFVELFNDDPDDAFNLAGL